MRLLIQIEIILNNLRHKINFLKDFQLILYLKKINIYKKGPVVL